MFTDPKPLLFGIFKQKNVHFWSIFRNRILALIHAHIVILKWPSLPLSHIHSIKLTKFAKISNILWRYWIWKWNSNLEMKYLERDLEMRFGNDLEIRIWKWGEHSTGYDEWFTLKSHIMERYSPFVGGRLICKVKTQTEVNSSIFPNCYVQFWSHIVRIRILWLYLNLCNFKQNKTLTHK